MNLTDRNTIITTVVLAVVIAGLGYFFLGRSQPAEGAVPVTSRFGSFLKYGIFVLLIGFGVYFIYEGVMGDKARSSNLAPTPVDAASTVVVPADQAPPQSGPYGGNYGMQWWMFVQDWDTKYGEQKPVIRRGSDKTFNPYIYLHPTENNLSVQISIFPPEGSGKGASEPAAVGAEGSSTDDSFTCTVPNIPLQKWTAVGVSVSGRNVDIYLDGMLVRSCLLPGVPKTPTGSIEIMPGGGFSGSVVDVYHYSRALVPADAQKFAAAGTRATATNALPSKSLFGYTVKLGVVDDAGKEVKKFVL